MLPYCATWAGEVTIAMADFHKLEIQLTLSRYDITVVCCTMFKSSALIAHFLKESLTKNKYGPLQKKNKRPKRACCSNL